MHDGGSGYSSDDDPGPLVTAFEADHEFEAHTVAAVLADAGIKAFVFCGGVLGYSDPVFGLRGRVSVQVPEAFLARARAALKQAKYIGASIDWDSVDVGEGEPDSPRVSTLVHVLLRTMAVLGWLVGAAIIVTSVVAIVLFFVHSKR